jgi:peroxiredoxin
MPAFALQTPAGQLVTADDVRGAPAVLVAFLCNHCPYVQHIAAPLGALTAGWMRDGLAVVGIMSNDVTAYPDDAPEHMVAFAEAHGWTFPYLFDAEQDAARAFGAACTPDFFLYGADNALAYRGRLDASRPGSETPVTGEDLAAAVHAVLRGDLPEEPQLHSIGCSIKWRADGSRG